MIETGGLRAGSVRIFLSCENTLNIRQRARSAQG